MKKNEPKVIINLSIEESEIEKKVKLAMDKYVEDVVNKNLDEYVKKVIDDRIDRIIQFGNSYYSSRGLINGTPIRRYVENRINDNVEKIIDENIDLILNKKLTERLAKLMSEGN